MEAAKRKLLEQTHQTILKVGFEDNDYELIADLISTNFVAFGTALDEKIFGIKDLKALLKRQKEQSKGFDMNVEISTLYTHLSENENTAIYIDEGVLSIKTNEESIDMILRLSMVLEYIEDKWLMVHFHSSKPEEVESEKDTWGIETWKERAEELEKEVAERTADLVLKNQDLEIEAALERVRSRSMAMHSSEELNDVLSVMFQQVEVLGIDAKCAHLTLMDLENNRFSFRISGKNGAANIGEQIIDLNAMPIWKDTVSKWKKAKPHSHQCLVYSPEVLPDLWKLINTSLKSLPAKERIKINDFPNGLFDCEGHTKFGYIGFNNSRPPTEEEISIVIRFASEFERVYQRFLDIQKAEAQAREVQIQLCLERVRAKSMAMQSSNELETIIQEVHDQFVDLGITLDHAGFIIDYKSNDDMIIWLADEHKVTPQIRLPYFDSPHWNSFITAKKQGHKLFVNHLDFKTKNKFYKQIFKYVPELPEDARSFYLKIPSLTIATSLIDTIGLYIENFSGVQYRKEDQMILLRFGEEFQQAYTRFLDLKKAEAQARESQIQLSLERVRAKSMAMQSSDELHEVIGVVFQQFDNLGIHPVNVFLSLFHREERTLTYRASGKSGKRTPTKQNVDIDSVEAWTDLYNKWINDSSDDIEVIFYPKELVPEIFKLLKETFAAMPKADRMTVEDFPEGGYSTLGYTPFGYLGYDHTRPPTEEEKDILKRICTEFGRVYQRFLDIKKAEAQAREAQIEAALEKVRSRSLAMHHSDEVGEVANILLKKLEELELNIDNEAVIMILSQDGTRNSEMWLASPDIYNSATLFDTPYMGSKLEKALWDKIEESNVDYFTKQFSKKVKNEYFNLAFEHSEFKYLPEDRKQYVLDSETYSYFCALKKYTSIVIPCHTGKLLTIDQIEILKRFSRVFEQTYIRFQDLKKAEAQARESEIQLALERVRASSLAMQSSADLTEVLTVLFSQFNVLGIQPLFAHLTLFDEENNRFSVRMTGRQGQRILAEQYIDVNEVDSWKESYMAWQNGQPGDINCIYYPPEVLGQVLEVLKEINDALPKGSKLYAKDFPNGSYTIQANFEYGYIGFNDDKMATEEQQAIVKRFAKEFSSAYQRFLDIEKAEAQAREAQIEAALEKVRSRSLAMQSSNELQDVVQVVAEKIQELGVVVDPVGVIICTYPDGDKSVVHWTYTPDNEDRSKPYFLPYFKHPIWDETLASKNNGDSYFSKSYSKKIKNNFLRTIYTRPDSDYKNLPEEFKSWQLASPIYNLSFGWEKNSAILLPNNDGLEPNEEQLKILVRFAKVFEQSYVRFLDLQKAEAQAREAQIEVALERIRARAMAMHHPDELAEVLSLMFEQLSELNVDTLWTHLTLIDLDNNTFTYRMTSKDGTPVHTEQVVQLDAMDAWSHTIETFKSQNPETITHIHFLPEMLPRVWELFDDIFSSLPEEAKMNPADFPDGIHTTESNCKFGYLGINQSREATAEEKRILGRFGNEFGRLYQRYLDIEKAEAQAREAQIEASMERIRARAMAMHHPSELSEVLTLMFTQLDLLGVETAWTHLTLVDLEKNTFTYRMTGREGKRVDVEQVVALDASPVWIHATETFKSEKPDSITRLEFKPETLSGLWELFDGIFSSLPKGYQIFPEDFPEGLFATQANCKYGYLGINQTRKATAEEEKILGRFGSEFGRLYQRYLDIEKAEAQAREAQIEAALERVRARAMAMHKTDELTDVLCVLFDQFDLLGINPVLTHLTLMDEENETFSLRITTTAENRIVCEQLIDINAIDAWKNSFDNWKNSEPNAVDCIDYTPEQIPIVFELLQEVMNALPKGHKIYPKDFPEGLFTTQGHFKFGYIGFNHTRRATEEEKSIVERFAREFGRTYQRFLDLQKAEEQAREAQIEAALEKVRSRSLAMHQSTEMQEVANEIRNQLLHLGLEIDALAMSGVIDNESDYDVWVGGANSERPLRIPYNNDTQVQRDFNKAIKERPELFTKTYKGKVMKAYFKHLMATSNSFNPELEQFMLTCTGFTNTLTFMKNSGIQIIRYTDKAFSEADNNIVKRFGKVFEQAYIRFLDLQKSEAQAREAQIEMALEKVRSRTMAMQKSEELPLAANNLFLQVQELGIPAWSAGYCIWQDDKHHASCNMSSEGEIQKSFILPSIGEGYDFYTPQKKGERFHVKELGGEALVKHYEFMKELPNVGQILKELINAGLELPTFQIFHICYFKYGYVMFITYEEVPEAHNIFQRFSKVFEQTYTRFLDLEQAEARARESQIQSALERVRSHSMGMQGTADFANVTTEMFNQLRNFGEDLFATGIVFCDKHKGHVEQWHSIPGAGMLSPMIVPIDLDYIHQYRYDQWKAGNTLFSIEIPSNFINQHFEDIFKLPSAQLTLKELESRNTPMPAPPEWEIDYGASFKHGYILASSLKPLENMDILPRFAQVFEQAYIRFMDLQKAEAQARESQIEAALEKVRSRTLAMQKSDELADTSVVVFKELLELGIEPNRLFIGIVKDNGDAIEAWATNEDGSKIEQHFKLHTSKNKSIKKMVDGWKRQKKSAIIDMKGKELQEYFHYLNEVMHIPFIDGLKQKRRVQTIAYFSGGLIGMAAPAEQPEETIDLLERFAAVFNLTYTRFNDLKIAEAQAIQAEEDLINLQKAKRYAEEALAELQSTQKQLIQSEKMASLGELTAGIAHEIQNPLNFVNNFSEVSKELIQEMLEEMENGDTEEVKAIAMDIIQNLEKINHHGKRADGIVKGMLQHSRAGGDKKEATNINALADEYLRLAFHGLRAKDKSFNAELVTDFDESIKSINVIPQDIGRVILNLLTNAFYVVNEKSKLNIPEYKPTVKISTKIKAKDLEITVTDNGSGMPDSVKEKIFQPFFTTKPTGQGTGLGLSMSYDIITKGHGGELKVESKEGLGTTFTIEIPLQTK